MKIHTDVLTEQDIRDALKTEKESGRIAPTVTFKILDPKGSRSHARAFEIQLHSWDFVKGDGRRRGNDGAYGAMQEYWAACFDEWGFFLAALYRVDGRMVVGTVKNPIYADADDYAWKTAETYTLGGLLAQLEHGNDPFPYVFGHPKIGRYGAGRHEEQRYSVFTYRPRTAEWYRKFAHLADAPV
jgi:hypothetical protein